MSTSDPSDPARTPRLRTALWIRTATPRDKLLRALSALPVVTLEGDHDAFVHLVYDVDRWHNDDNADTHAALVANLRSVLAMSDVVFEAAIGHMLEPLPLRLPKHLRVLVVDDVANEATALSEYLRLCGHATRAAHSGADALRLARGFRPDAELLDLGMPDMDGVEVCRELRGTEETRDAVLVAVTARERQAIASRGFDDHLLKPVLPSRAEQRVRELVARRQHLRQRG